MMPAILLLVVKSVLLLGAAAVLTLLMQRRSAASRHLVWSVALTSALALPVLAFVAPAWTVPVQPWLGLGGPSMGSLPSTAPVLAVAPTVPGPARGVVAPAFVDGAPIESASSAPAVAAAPDISNTLRTAATGERGPWLIRSALVVWVIGAAFLLLRALVSALSLGAIVRRAARVDADPALRVVLSDAAIRCTVCDVDLRVSDEVDVPLTWGMSEPVVLLPFEAVEWSVERRMLVLEHELAHVARRDVWMHLVGRVARAVWWINPLAWYAERELRLESEQACDDVVLARGCRPTRYAEELLDIAGALGSRAVPSLAPGFASRPRIERRLAALLDPALPRRIASRFDGMLAVICVLAFALPLAAARPVAAPPEPVIVVPAAAPLPVPAAAEPLRAVPGAPVRAAPVPTATPAAPPAVDVQPSAPIAAAIASRAPTCAPDGRSSSNMSSDDDGVRRWEVHWTGRDCSVDLRALGRIDFTDDLGDVRAIAPGGWLDVSVRDGDRLTRVYVKPDGDGTVERRYTVDGQPRPWDAAARQWFGGLLVDLDRRTAFAVDVRLPRLLSRGGPNAVLDEVGQITGDYARGVYLRKLMETATLDRGQVRRVIALAGSGMHSDYEIARVLIDVANRYGLPDADTRAAFLTAVDGIKSDYEHNRTLHALLDRSQPTEAEAGAILASASRLKSDYELSRTLVDLVARKLVTPALVETYLSDAARITSDYEKSRALVALAGAYPLKGSARDQYQRAADGIHSEYERGRALAALSRDASR